jgi:hypothetical protein
MDDTEEPIPERTMGVVEGFGAAGRAEPSVREQQLFGKRGVFIGISLSQIEVEENYFV